MGTMHPCITVGVELLQSQLDAANCRIIRANRQHLDNEYAEGVRDALAWLMGACQAPFKGEIEDEEIA